VEPNELARVAFNGTRVGRDLGCVLVVDDVQLERVGVVRANVVVGGSASIGCLCVVCDGVVFGWLCQVELIFIGTQHVTQSTV
jgi:hypothetical protein